MNQAFSPGCFPPTAPGFSTRTLAFRDFSLPRRRFESPTPLPLLLSISRWTLVVRRIIGAVAETDYLNAKETATSSLSLAPRVNETRSSRATRREEMPDLRGRSRFHVSLYSGNVLVRGSRRRESRGRARPCSFIGPDIIRGETWAIPCPDTSVSGL